MASAEYLQTALRVLLDAIPSVEEALRDLGTFAFVALHIFFAGGWHSLAVVDILCLIESLEELHTEVQGIISPPHPAMTLLYNVLRRWSLYSNRCVDALASEALEALGANVPFSLKPILVQLKGGALRWPQPPHASRRLGVRR